MFHLRYCNTKPHHMSDHFKKLLNLDMISTTRKYLQADKCYFGVVWLTAVLWYYVKLWWRGFVWYLMCHWLLFHPEMFELSVKYVLRTECSWMSIGSNINLLAYKISINLLAPVSLKHLFTHRERQSIKNNLPRYNLI